MDYSHASYRSALKSLVEEVRGQGQRLTYTELAEAARIQKAYLSKVLRGDADLSPDQLFLILKHMRLGREESDFLMLLLEKERSALTSRRLELEEQLERFRKNREKTIKRLKGEVEEVRESLTEYYSDIYAQIVHVALNIARFQKDPKLLYQSLGISSERFHVIVEKLKNLNLLEQKEGQLRALKSWMHLPAESPLSVSHRNLARLASQAQMSRRADPHDYSVTVSFSADEKSRAKIRDLILETVSKIEEVVRASQDHEVYQLNLDLFSWTS